MKNNVFFWRKKNYYVSKNPECYGKKIHISMKHITINWNKNVFNQHLNVKHRVPGQWCGCYGKQFFSKELLSATLRTQNSHRFVHKLIICSQTQGEQWEDFVSDFYKPKESLITFWGQVIEAPQAILGGRLGRKLLRKFKDIIWMIKY